MRAILKKGMGTSSAHHVMSDTTPVIESYNAYIGSNGAIIAGSSNYCVTKLYPFDTDEQSFEESKKTKISIMYMIPSESTLSLGRVGWYINGVYKASTPIYPKPQQYMGTIVREDLADNRYNGVRFTLDSRRLDDCVAYFYKTGEIIFAGRNTNYYGCTNISEVD